MLSEEVEKQCLNVGQEPAADGRNLINTNVAITKFPYNKLYSKILFLTEFNLIIIWLYI